MIPEICACLKQKNLTFQWYVVGEGEERPLIEAEIEKQGVSDCLLLLGAKNNPCPYIKNADLFVLTSSWESYGMVVTEALILGTPVIAGDYPALHEILDDGVNGVIAPNNVQGIADAVARVMTDKKQYETLKAGAKNFAYSPDLAIQQLLSLKEN